VFDLLAACQTRESNTALSSKLKNLKKEVEEEGEKEGEEEEDGDLSSTTFSESY